MTDHLKDIFARDRRWKASRVNNMNRAHQDRRRLVVEVLKLREVLAAADELAHGFRCEAMYVDPATDKPFACNCELADLQRAVDAALRRTS